jgi:hypothetical protein
MIQPNAMGMLENRPGDDPMFWVVILGVVVAILALILLGVGYLQGWPVHPHGFKQKGVVGGAQLGEGPDQAMREAPALGPGLLLFVGLGFPT